jgi:DNA-binding transcriptional regulator YiaG
LSIVLGVNLEKILENYVLKYIDNTSPSVVLCNQMTEAQSLLTILRENKWTNSAIADAIGVTVSSVDKWQADERNTSQSHLILLRQLINKKPPKRRRYAKGSRKSASEEEAL